MKSLFKTIVVPEGTRYNNEKDNLIVNTKIDIKDYKYTNRVGIVVEPPHYNSQVKKGDRVLVHHNVFRQYWGFSTHLRTSSSDLDDGTFSVDPDSIYAYDRGDGWIPLNDWLFIEPINNKQEGLILDLDEYKQRLGKVALTSSNELTEGDTVSFSPLSEYEFRFDDYKVYRMRMKDITAKIL